MSSRCSTKRLEAALAGNLPADEEASLCHHLEECEQCGAALERLAGGASWCQEAAALLTADALDDAVPGRETWSESDFTVEHLEASDEPHVLGRLGGYDVLEILGRGGMGVVLKGYDRELKRCVAIKVLAPHLAPSSLARKRFAREAQAAAAVVHANVLAIHQVQPSGRLPFLVMPLVAGESLGERLAAQGTLQLKESLRIGMQAAAGLAAAHEQGLVHRDVKPANILLEKGVERAVLTDFGLACAADDVALTQWGIVAGTPQYMSPEQARGEPLDGRSDLFSLGCVLYEMATGVSPFKADSTMATMRRLVDDAPQAMASLNPELPPWFIAIVGRLLEKEPSRRFDSAKEVSELLEGCLAHLQQPASVPLPASLAESSVQPDQGRRQSRFKGVLAMFATVGILLLGAFGWVQSEPPDIAGQWTGQDWGTVVLTKTNDGEFTGTYTDTFGKKPGAITLKWSRIERRFNGTWCEGQALAFSADAKTLAQQKDRFGDLSVRLVNNEIRGAFTTDRNAVINPATPRLADLLWVRGQTASPEPSKPGGQEDKRPFHGYMVPKVAAKQAEVTVAEEQKILAEARQQLAQAAVDRAQISFLGWEAEVKRVTNLLSKGLVDRSVVEEASRQLADAKASWAEMSAKLQVAERDVKVAQARLQSAQAELAATKHTAPRKPGGADADRAPPAQMPVPTVLGPKAFRAGDVIAITDVRATSAKLEQGDSITVRGQVRLASHDQAELCLYLTQTNGDGKEEVDPAQTIQVKRGVGAFELKATIKHRGFLHLTLYNQLGNPFGGVYFGTALQMKQIEGWSLDYYLQEKAPEKAEVGVKRAAVKLAGEQKSLAESKQKLAQADIATAKANVLRWEAEVKRAEKLVAERVYDRATFDEVKAQFGAAKASLAEAEARLQIAELEATVAQARLQLAQAELSEAEWRQTDGLAVKRAQVKLAEEQKSLAESKQKLAQAVIATAKARVLRWESQVERATKLVAQGIYDQATLDEVKSQFNSAKASLAETEATLQVAEREVKVAEARLQLARAELAEAVSRRDQPAQKESSSKDLEKARKASFQAEYAAAQLVLLGHFENAHFANDALDLKKFDIMHPKIDFVIERVLKWHEIVRGKTKVTLPQLLMFEGYMLPLRIGASKSKVIIFCDGHKDKINCRMAIPLADDTAVLRALRWIEMMQKQLDKERPKAGGTDAKKNADAVHLQVGEPWNPLPEERKIIHAQFAEGSQAVYVFLQSGHILSYRHCPPEMDKEELKEK